MQQVTRRCLDFFGSEAMCHMLFLGLLCQRGIGIKWEPGGDSVGVPL